MCVPIFSIHDHAALSGSKWFQDTITFEQQTQDRDNGAQIVSDGNCVVTKIHTREFWRQNCVSAAGTPVSLHPSPGVAAAGRHTE